MLLPMDIYRAAKLLVTKYGQDALERASLRADSLLQAGDVEGHGRWSLVARAIEEIATERAPAGAPVSAASL
jgi:hypothetical protein